MSETLCAPSPDLTCFGCCPPIRPARYDPLDHARILKREFRENRRLLRVQGPAFKPVVGFSCWALGFLDDEGKKAGCLLHPFQNGGRDLRHLIDYGSKCARESCVPARHFETLPREGKDFWLNLVRGFNTFFYSSRRANPLFHLMPWGRDVLEPLRRSAQMRLESATELLDRFPFLMSRRWGPQGVRYVFARVLEHMPGICAALPSPGSTRPTPGSGSNLVGGRRTANDLLEWACRRVLSRCAGELENHWGVPDPEHECASEEVSSVYTHLLDLPEDLKDFLRLTLGRQKTSPNLAVWVNENIAFWIRESTFRLPPLQQGWGRRGERRGL